MATTEKIGISIEAEVDKNSFNKAEKEVENFARDTGKKLDNALLLELQINKANLTLELEKTRALLRKAKKENDKQAIIDLTVKSDTLRSNLTEAGRQLNNYKNTGDVATSRLQAKFNSVNDKIDESNTLLGITRNKLAGLSKAFLGYFAFTTITSGIKSIVNSAADIEQTQVAFENLTGSITDAAEIINQAKEFAAKTPFSFVDITESEKKLISIAGIAKNDLIPTIKALGDIASSQGKGINQVTEAFNDAIVGEFERLKEFGIRASQSGDQVTFTFKGQETTVKKTQEAISQYLIALSNAEGVSGSMEKQSQTLNGRLSTLKDNLINVGSSIGSVFIPAIGKATEQLTRGVSLFGAGLNKVFQLFAVIRDALGVGIVAIGEGFYEVGKFIQTNFENITNNLGLLLQNFAKNVGISFQNAGRLALQQINKIIEQINKIPGVNIQTLNVQPLKDFVSSGLDFSGVNFDILRKNIDKLGNSFDELTGKVKDTNKEIIDNNNDVTSTIVNNNEEITDSVKENTKTQAELLEELEDLKKKQAEEELARQKRNLRYNAAYNIDLIKQSDKSETEKASLIIKINDDLNNKLNKLNNDRVDDEKDAADKIIALEEKKNKKRQDELDVLKEGVESVMEVYDKEIENSQDKIKDLSDDLQSVTDDIAGIEEALSKLEEGRATTLGERNVEISQRQKEIQEELKALSEEDNTTDRLIEEQALNKELNELLQEQALIKQNASKDELDKAKRLSELSPTALFLEQYEEEKKALEERKTAKEQEILDLQNQKADEEIILNAFQEKRLNLENSYAEKVKSIQEEITDKTEIETNKQIEFLKNLQLQAEATAEALRSAGITASDSSGTTTDNSKTITQTFNVNNQVDLDSAINKINSNI